MRVFDYIDIIDIFNIPEYQNINITSTFFLANIELSKF